MHRNRRYELIVSFGIGIFLCPIFSGNLNAQAAPEWDPNNPDPRSFSRVLYSISKLQNFTEYNKISILLNVPIQRKIENPDEAVYSGNIKWIRSLGIFIANNDSLPFLKLSGRILKLNMEVNGKVFCVKPYDLNVIFGSNFRTMPLLPGPLNTIDGEDKKAASAQGMSNGLFSEIFTVNENNNVFINFDFNEKCLTGLELIVKCETNANCPTEKQL